MKLKDINRADKDRRLGIMFGLAYGDALGRPTEFVKGEVLAKFDPFRHAVGINRPRNGIVTDDTQMSIAVARAATAHGTPTAMTAALTEEFIRWYDDPKSRDGQRAPGATCLSSVRALKMKPNWLLATDTGSKGNGANMRVAPLALRTDWTWDQMGGAAQLQAAMTHGHATALAASHLTAAAVRMLLEGVHKPGEPLLEALLAFAYDQRERYYGDWLGGLWKAPKRTPMAQPTLSLAALKPTWWEDAEGTVPAVGPWDLAVSVKPRRPGRPAATSPEEWISRGWDSVISALYVVYGRDRLKQQDPCGVAGEGWVAEEALAAALHTLLCFPDDPTNALRRAAFTGGDSDSIASITGALAGAAYGRKAFPSHWIDNIEYRRDLESLTGQLTHRC